MTAPVLEVVELVKHYGVGHALFGTPALVHAVDDVSLTLAKGETLTLVGESGCGKSTLAKCLLRLVEPTSGKVLLHGQDILQLDASVFRKQRGTIQIVFQDPYASLDPRQKIFQVVATPLRLHGIGDRRDRVERVARVLQQVGIGPELMDRHPHELSGGQRQRVAIARALAVEPDILILDEPVSSLDMSIQAQVINLLIRLQRTFNISYLLISHNLPLVQHISDRIAVMYLGQIVEIGDREVLQEAMLHPYTQALFSAAPVIETKNNKSGGRVILSGDVPSPINPPAGCRFHTRCPFKQDRCINQVPRLRMVRDRQVACHFAGEVDFQALQPKKAANPG